MIMLIKIYFIDLSPRFVYNLVYNIKRVVDTVLQSILTGKSTSESSITFQYNFYNPTLHKEKLQNTYINFTPEKRRFFI